MHISERSDTYLRECAQLDRSILLRIREAESKILRTPQLGKPLSHDLSGLFAERVGGWRIIYTYDEHAVYFLHCRARKDAY